MNKLEIYLANGHKLVTELCEYGNKIPPEIAICIQDENSIAIQDIVLVRAKQKSLSVVDDTNVGADVLVWADQFDEDYTHKFKIDEWQEE